MVQKKAQVDYHSLIEAMPISVALLDRELRVVAANMGFEALTGFSLEEAAGLPCRYVTRTDLCLKRCPAAAALEEKKRQQAEGTIINRDRELIPVLVTTSPLLDSEGETVGVIETMRELSETGLDRESPVFHEYDDFIGHSPAIQKIKEILPAIASTDSSVLIIGETGTGKDLIASVIHRLSPRSQGPFIKVNCGALPETLLESELFGHVRGAFTGAVRDKPGRFQLAENGTIYLTEIGDLHLPLQVKLLSFLDDKEIIPVGGTRTFKTDVRVVAATHRDLETMVEEGTFRGDLLYRLKVVRITLPPLRERGDDIRLLIEHFLDHFRKKFGKNIEGLTDEALSILLRHPYPGNVRELRNTVEYAASICPSGSIRPIQLPEYLLDSAASRPGTAPPPAKSGGGASTREDVTFSIPPSEAGESWDHIERRMITEALVQCRGNRTKAADMLGWGRSTLWRKMKRYGLQ